jgi:hypothetical protein
VSSRTIVHAHAAIFLCVIILASMVVYPVISALSQNVTIPSYGTINYISPLHVEGRYIKNNLGQIVYLRGVNKGWVDDYAGNWVPVGKKIGPNGVWNPQAVFDNLYAMADRDSNVVRFTISPYYWKFDNSTAHFKQNIKDTANMAAALGMYVILVGYQVLPYSMDARQDALPYPPYQDGSNPDGDNQLALATIGSRSDFVDWWADVADELKGYPNVIFELWNEPHDGEFDDWTNVVQQTIDAIRATGSNNLIMVQWRYDIWYNQGGCSTLQWIEDMNLSGTNIVYSTHSYVEFMDGGSPTATEYNVLKSRFQSCLVDWVGSTLNKPLIIGELGASVWFSGEDWSNMVLAFTSQLAIFTDWEIGYLAWTWKAGGKHPLLQSERFIPPPSTSGQILINSINGISPPPSSPSLAALHVRAHSGVGYVVATADITGVGTYSTPTLVELSAGNYFLEVTFGGQTLSQQVSLTAGETTTVDLYF